MKPMPIVLAAVALFLAAPPAQAASFTPKPPTKTAEPPTSAPKPHDAPPNFVAIPGGEFTMGADDGEKDEKPAHTVRIKPFQLMTTEVSVGQFRTWAEATNYQTDAEREGGSHGINKEGTWGRFPFTWKDPGYPQEDSFPVVCVSWQDAARYCSWVGGRLPTEAEWELAAGNGAKHTRYSWGNDLPTTPVSNMADEFFRAEAAKAWLKRPEGEDAEAKLAEEIAKKFPEGTYLKGVNDGYFQAAPVTTGTPNEFGLLQMSGNVREWCYDWYKVDYYGETPTDNPEGPEKGMLKALRSGAWNDGPSTQRVTNRVGFQSDRRANHIGFRCAKDAPK